jgi:chorismate dehydratase
MLVPGVPSALNRMLQQGEIDASPSSSFEYARNWRDYLLLPGHSISSIGSIASVLLFSPLSPDQLSGVEIALTGESATSINLLEILLRDYYGLSDVVTRVPTGVVEDLVRKGKPALLIGDRALQLVGTVPQGVGVYDLGKLWHQHTGLPFVFALWMVRKEVVQWHGEALAHLGEQLLKSRQSVLQQPQLFAEAAAQKTMMNPEQIISYWNTISYVLDNEHIRGLELFIQRCFKHGLLNEAPSLNFLKS